MTPAELIEMCSQEAIERATKAYIDAVDGCTGEDIHLSHRQKVIVGTALLNSFMGLDEALAGMLRASEVIGRFDMTRIGDEVEAWLADHEGPSQ